MKGIIRQTALGTCLGATFAVLAGCVPHYRELVDPCWPERYNYQARHSVRDAFNTQAANGHALDQTIWNQHFESGSDKLTDAGKEHLKYLARRRPVADPRVFVQTGWDAKGERAELDTSRVQAVQSYLQNVVSGRGQAVTFDVTVTDAAEPGLRSRAAPNMYITPPSAGTLLSGGASGTAGTAGQQTSGGQYPSGQQGQNAPQQSPPR